MKFLKHFWIHDWFFQWMKAVLSKTYNISLKQESNFYSILFCEWCHKPHFLKWNTNGEWCQHSLVMICSFVVFNSLPLSDPYTQPWNSQFGIWSTSPFILHSSEIASTSLASNFTTKWMTPKSMSESLSNLLSFTPCLPECFINPKNSTGPTSKSISLSNSCLAFLFLKHISNSPSFPAPNHLPLLLSANCSSPYSQIF